MKVLTRLTVRAGLAAGILAFLPPAPGASLGEMMREAGVERIFGSWVDADSEGGEVKMVRTKEEGAEDA